MTSFDLAAIGAVLLVGVPHGGLDGAVARRIGWPKGALAWMGFNLSYVLLAGLVAWIWWQWPILSLSVFLIISALHFGASDIALTESSSAEKSFMRWLPLITHGGLVCIAIPNFQAIAVQPLFTLLVGDIGAAMLINGIGMLFLPLAPVFVCLLYLRSYIPCMAPTTAQLGYIITTSVVAVAPHQFCCLFLFMAQS